MFYEPVLELLQIAIKRTETARHRETRHADQLAAKRSESADARGGDLQHENHLVLCLFLHLWGGRWRRDKRKDPRTHTQTNMAYCAARERH